VAGQHGSLDVTVAHNLKGLLSTSDRASQLLRAAALVEDVTDGVSLIVGCRNEDDLFAAKAMGYRSVWGVDLISYSPRVTLGDMHHLPFRTNSFDAVLVPYTLSYSTTPQVAAREYLRVTREGGVIGIAVEYAPAALAAEISRSLVGYEIDGDQRIDSAGKLLALFGDRVGEVVVRYDALKRRHHLVGAYVPRPSSILLVFTVRLDDTAGQ
jgi:SAM-dependent methyltransferase